MPRRLEADDEVRRFTSVWLGPPGYSLPFHARYIAYVVGFLTFVTIMLIEAITPLPMGLPPVWEGCATVLITTLVMSAVDHDKPLGAIIRNARNVARAPAPDKGRERHLRPHLGTIVKITKEPLNEASR